MKVINKKGKIVNVTEKMWKYMYKERGFKKYDPSKSHVRGLNKEVDLLDMTNYEIRELLDELGIEYKARDSKKDLIKRYEEGVL